MVGEPAAPGTALLPIPPGSLVAWKRGCLDRTTCETQNAVRQPVSQHGLATRDGDASEALIPTCVALPRSLQQNLANISTVNG